MAPELQSITGEPPPIFGRFFSSDSSEISVHMRKRWVLLQIIRLMFNSIWVFLKFENSTLSSLIFLGYSMCRDVKSWFLPSALLMCFFFNYCIWVFQGLLFHFFALFVSAERQVEVLVSPIRIEVVRHVLRKLCASDC